MRWVLTIACVGVSLVTASPAAAVPDIPECKGAVTPSVTGDCGSVSGTGCCDLYGRALWCAGNNLYCLDCTDGFEACGWNPVGYYDCGQEAGSVDPGGSPAACDACAAECSGGAACSPTCPGSCGSCAAGGEVCLEDGSCYAPQCAGKECGEDPLGFSCGSCPPGSECVDGIFSCEPRPDGCNPHVGPGCDGCACEACVCGAYPTCCSDNWDLFCATACESECGMDCAPCVGTTSCEAGMCGVTCGLDCGDCPAGELCLDDHQCCAPSCAGKECGDDGCGSSCGECDPFDSCVDGLCVACQPACAGKECGDDACGGECGMCAAGETCHLGQCVGCVPDCVDKECGDDGCGGSCGECPVAGQLCEDFRCTGCGYLDWIGCCDGDTVLWCEEDQPQSYYCPNGCGWDPASYFYTCGFSEPEPSGQYPHQCLACAPQCAGKECGDDGCGSTCGECQPGEVCHEGRCDDPECLELGEAGCCVADGLRYCSHGQLAGYECLGMSCGWDATGPNGKGWYDCGFLGSDPAGEHPQYCPFCEPACDGLVCGGDGCGGSCGDCPAGESCVAGACQPDVSPDAGHAPDAGGDAGGPIAPDPGTIGGGSNGGCATGDRMPTGGPVTVLLLLAGLALALRRNRG